MRPIVITPGQENAGQPGIEVNQQFLNPKKYQGALDGFGVTPELASSSKGAFTKTDQPIKNTNIKIAPRYSRTTKLGHTSIFFSGASPGRGAAEKPSFRIRQNGRS
jgi:hypothetical protein